MAPPPNPWTGRHGRLCAVGQELRHRMKVATRVVPLPGNSAPFRPVKPQDAAPLALLMERAYRGTIDDEGETPEQCLEEVRALFAGKYGRFLDDASFLIERDGQSISASLVTLWEGQPLLAFSMTVPNERRKGHAGFLIRRSIDALASRGHQDLYLVVTDGNPAERLYAKLGFVRTPAARTPAAEGPAR